MSETPGYRPLYRQVYDIVVSKVAKGTWRPGRVIAQRAQSGEGIGGQPGNGAQGPGRADR